MFFVFFTLITGHIFIYLFILLQPTQYSVKASDSIFFLSCVGRNRY